MEINTTTEPSGSDDEAETAPVVDDDAMRLLVTRLARPHRSGGRAIERASLLSSGADFDAAMAWIESHGGEPELPAASRSSGGLHSARLSGNAPAPLRFVMPAGALG
ncbi:MAG: hypothetical protein QOC68_3662 [Solirubrobacteraceae bacterium]|jgi:hypothetical protein|nr:hypothetical protein [Solirubrobacteraceae bacterium]